MSQTLQVCYVIVSTGWDRHAQMAWLSARSLRLQDSRVRIIAIVEGMAPGAGATLHDRFAGVADLVVEKPSDVASPVAKSRFHRMRIREYFSGPLLYVDSDTLAVGPVADVVDCGGDVGAVMDFNHHPDSTWNPPELEAPFHALGWQYPLPRWLNAGVYFLRDRPGVHAFCDEWVARWRQPAAGAAHTWDQSTFNSALWASGVKHCVLPHGYNAMVVKRGYRFRESRLLHFFGSTDEQRGTLLEHLLQHLQVTGEFDERAYRRSIREGHPWGPNPEPWRLVRSRNYVRAAFTKARAALRGRR